MWKIKPFTDEVLVCTRHLFANALIRRATLFLAEQKCRTNLRCDFNSWSHCAHGPGRYVAQTALKKAAAYTTLEKMLHTRPGERCTTHSPGKNGAHTSQGNLLHSVLRKKCCAHDPRERLCFEYKLLVTE